jgi:hypothetical protein
MKAIAYFANGIGNLVMMMPALQAVASMTEDGTVDICLGEWQDSRKPAVYDILRAWRTVGRVYEWPKNGFDPKSYALWFYSPHSTGCDVVNTFRANMGYRPVARPAWRESLIHEVDHYMEIAYSMGYRGAVPKIEFPVADGPVLDALPRPLIVVCNGYFRTSTGYWDKKGWPHFEALAEALRRFFGGSIVGIGGAGELPPGFRCYANFAGRLTILETAKVISQADLVVTTDTGNMHIAAALDIPTVALFGPTLTSKNAPRGKKAVVLTAGTECAPCQDTARFMTCRDYVCMRSITAGDVMAVAREVMRHDRQRAIDRPRRARADQGPDAEARQAACRQAV